MTVNKGQRIDNWSSPYTPDEASIYLNERASKLELNSGQHILEIKKPSNTLYTERYKTEKLTKDYKKIERGKKTE